MPNNDDDDDDTTYIYMHTNVILTNKRRTHAQSNYTNTKLKAWFRGFLRQETEWAYSTSPDPHGSSVLTLLLVVVLIQQQITYGQRSQTSAATGAAT